MFAITGHHQDETLQLFQCTPKERAGRVVCRRQKSPPLIYIHALIKCVFFKFRKEPGRLVHVRNQNLRGKGAMFLCCSPPSCLLLVTRITTTKSMVTAIVCGVYPLKTKWLDQYANVIVDFVLWFVEYGPVVFT